MLGKRGASYTTLQLAGVFLAWGLLQVRCGAVRVAVAAHVLPHPARP